MNKSSVQNSGEALDRALLDLGTQIEILHNYLEKARPAAVPPVIYETVNTLLLNLPIYRNQVMTLYEEQRNLRALSQMGQVVNSSLHLDVVLKIVMDTVIHLTSAERGYLMLVNPAGELTIRIGRNWEQESLDWAETIVSTTLIKKVVASRQAVLTTNAQEDPRFSEQQSIVAYQLRSIICIPMLVRNQLIGLIYIDNRIRSGLFTQKHMELLSAFADQAAVAIENARLFESVRQTLAEVTELKNLMDNVFSSIASGVLTADLEDRITLANRAAEAILGSRQDQLLGQDFNEILAAPEVPEKVDDVLKNNQPALGLETSTAIIGRGQLNLRLNISPLKDNRQNTQGVAIVIEDLTEKKKLEAQQRLFERMVAPAVIRQIDPNALQLGGKRAEITVLFADIRGFTSFSEEVTPEGLVKILNLHLAEAADAILGEEGTIDKFLGDAVMAWFNAPIPQADHALRAIRAALSIRTRIEKISTAQPETERLSFGIGIHTGEAILGLVGTEKRLDYTAIGDSVNTAKRIQENASAGQILISRDVYRLVEGSIVVTPVEPIHAKGKRSTIAVFEVLGLT